MKNVPTKYQGKAKMLVGKMKGPNFTMEDIKKLSNDEDVRKALTEFTKDYLQSAFAKISKAAANVLGRNSESTSSNFSCREGVSERQLVSALTEFCNDWNEYKAFCLSRQSYQW